MTTYNLQSYYEEFDALIEELDELDKQIDDAGDFDEENHLRQLLIAHEELLMGIHALEEDIQTIEDGENAN